MQGMTKQSVDAERKKLLSVSSEINQFETQVTEHYVYLLAHSFGGELQDGNALATASRESNPSV